MKLKNKNYIIAQINTDFDNYVHPPTPIPKVHHTNWSFNIKKSNNFRCQVCKTGKGLVAHHIIFKVDYPSLALNKNNGITLCKSCEDQAHGRELVMFMPKKIKVPSLKGIIMRRVKPKSPLWKRIIRYIFTCGNMN